MGFFYFINKTKWIELQKIKNPKQNKKKHENIILAYSSFCLVDLVSSFLERPYMNK